MTLKEAIKGQIQALGYTGAIFFGAIPSATDEALLLRDDGSHDADPTMLRIHPRILLYVRGESRTDTESIARAIYDFFHVNAPLELASGYRISRSKTSGLPRDLGRDGANLWRRSLDLLLTQPRNTEL